MNTKFFTSLLICFGVSFTINSKANSRATADIDDVLLQMEQVNREMEQDPRIIESKRLMDGELFLGCNSEGAADSLNYFIKELDKLKKYNSSAKSQAEYDKSRRTHYHNARKAVRYAQHLKLENYELSKLYK